MNSEDVVMSFGKHKSRTLGEIAGADLLYLDWLNGRDLTRTPEIMAAVADICERRKREIENLLDERDERHRARETH